MIKWIFIGLFVLLALMDFALVVACSRWERKEEYEAYMRWKERKNAERHKGE